MPKCVICNKGFDSADPDVLAIGAYGNPKHVCPECARDLDTVTVGRDADVIAERIAHIADLLTKDDHDELTFDTVNGILGRAAERLKSIKAGEYDFALDEKEDEEGFDEIPEELRESEEDREADRIDEEKNEKLDKFTNYVMIGALIGVGIFVIYKLVELFL